MDLRHRIVCTLRRILDTKRIRSVFENHAKFVGHLATIGWAILAIGLGQWAHTSSTTHAIETFLKAEDIPLSELEAMLIGLKWVKVQDHADIRRWYRVVFEMAEMKRGAYVHTRLPVVLLLDQQSSATEFKVYQRSGGEIEKGYRPKAMDWKAIPARLDTAHQLHRLLYQIPVLAPHSPTVPRPIKQGYEIQY